MAISNYDEYGQLTKEALATIYQDLVLLLQNYSNGEDNDAIQALNEQINILKQLTRKEAKIYDVRFRSLYYKSLKNEAGLIQFKNNRQSLNEAHEAILKIRDILSGSLKLANQVAIYKDFNGQIKRITESELDLLNASRGRYNARLGIVKEQIENLQKFNEAEELFSQHVLDFENFINARKDRWPHYNRGHVMEAFEGHFQHDHDGIMQDHYENLLNAIPSERQDIYIHFYYARKNKDIWYKGGDVGNVQVKFLDQKTSSISAGSKLSLREIVTYVINMFETGKNLSNSEIQARAKDLLQTFFEVAEMPADIANVVENELLSSIPKNIMR